VVIIVAAAAGGSRLMSGLYGAGFEAGRLELSLLAASVAFYLPAGTFAQALLALDRGAAAACSWAAAAVIFVALYAVAPGSALMRVSVALAVALFAVAAALGLLLLVDRRPNGPEEDQR
jgi:O-antigen/teichoic acid export membrane protein